jgi:hypothetical protein
VAGVPILEGRYGEHFLLGTGAESVVAGNPIIEGKKDNATLGLSGSGQETLANLDPLDRWLDHENPAFGLELLQKLVKSGAVLALVAEIAPRFALNDKAGMDGVEMGEDVLPGPEGRQKEANEQAKPA